MAEKKSKSFFWASYADLMTSLFFVMLMLFVVAVVEEREIDGKIYISGYVFTHSFLRVLNKPNDYVKMESNPNPNDDSDAFLCIRRVSDVESNAFSKPYDNWHLSEEYEKLIDKLEQKHSSR